MCDDWGSAAVEEKNVGWLECCLEHRYVLMTEVSDDKKGIESGRDGWCLTVLGAYLLIVL